MKIISENNAKERLERLPNWREKNGKLYREYSFHDFSTAFSFMTASAFVAEKMDHHPNWTNVYNKVSIELYTHSINGLSENDFILAEAMEKLAHKLLIS